jgi:hypothetical protein
VVDAPELPTYVFATGRLSGLKCEVMLRPSSGSLTSAVKCLGFFCFIASHNFSIVLHHLSLFIVFGGVNSHSR